MAGAVTEVDQLKAERDALLDRLARLQAEFDNARKRGLREQQEFRDFAAADVIKSMLPALDSFERALKVRRPIQAELGWGTHTRGERVSQRD